MTAYSRTALRLHALAMTVVAFAATALADEDAFELVQATIDELLQNVELQREDLEHDVGKSYQLIDALLRPRFDFEFGSSRVIPDDWEKASTAQQIRFADAFYEFIKASYGDLLRHIGEETLQIEGVDTYDVPVMGDVVIVNITVRLIDDTDVDVDLYMLDRGAGLLVFDLYANDLSFATRYRNEFADDILDFGLETLIADLEKQAALLREQHGQ